jgi:hypothetical protein
MHKKFCDLQRNPGYKAIICYKEIFTGRRAWSSQGKCCQILQLCTNTVVSVCVCVGGFFCTYKLILMEKYNKLTPESTVTYFKGNYSQQQE